MRFTYLIILIIFSLLSCYKISSDLSEKRVLGALSEPYHGIWKSDEYGYFISISSSKLEVYDLTNSTCVKTDRAPVLLDYIHKGSLRLTNQDQTLEFRVTLEEYPITLNRVETIPHLCTQKPSKTPIATFDAFTDFFETHYAFFDLYGVDWKDHTDALRLEVMENMTDQALFDLIQKALTPLKDGHVGLKAHINGTDATFSPGKAETILRLEAIAKAQGIGRSEIISTFRRKYWREDIARDILNGQGTLAGNNFIQYGITDDNIGFLAFATVFGYANKQLQDEEADLKALNAIMDSALDRFNAANVKAIIIDLGLNLGGHDTISRAIAARFTDHKITPYSKVAADSSLRTPFHQMITPYAGTRYLGPLYLLTSDITISGGETLTLALRALPNTVHMGTATSGALSDVLEKQLPNGWTISISNEIYTDHKGEIWEGRGIKPDIEIPVFEAQNPLSGHIPAINRVKQAINKNIL